MQRAFSSGTLKNSQCILDDDDDDDDDDDNDELFLWCG